MAVLHLVKQLCICLFAACCVLACEVGWTVHGGRCLKVLAGVGTFHAAQQACLTQASAPVLSRLVHLDTDADLVAVVSAAGLDTSQSYWVDAHIALAGMWPSQQQCFMLPFHHKSLLADRRIEWGTGQTVELSGAALDFDFSFPVECMKLSFDSIWTVTETGSCAPLFTCQVPRRLVPLTDIFLQHAWQQPT